MAHFLHMKFIEVTGLLKSKWRNKFMKYWQLYFLTQIRCPKIGLTYTLVATDTHSLLRPRMLILSQN